MVLLEKELKIASLIFAAGSGSRMKGFNGNKTLLPLVPAGSHYEGTQPILLQILSSLPSGPKALVINYKKEDVIKATHNLDITYCEQPELNGTGGALLAAGSFLENMDCSQLIITMGDVPFVSRSTYLELLKKLDQSDLVVLGFCPESKKQYGILEIKGKQVQKIIEWKYWSTYPEEKRQSFQVCNSGIYAAKRELLLRYMSLLASRPHKVNKKINGQLREVEEFFITDLVKYMHDDGLSVGYEIIDEKDVMGIDDLPSLIMAQKHFAVKYP